jgi:polyisoprenyl-teichoic acid--peptidoglycan teichoic acid transferase
MNAASGVLGQPMHAFVRVDFAAFEKIIDEVGGIDITVQRGFYDFLFKDGFRPGRQHMNGERALRFARYRYVLSEEGNNYARELRQQQVLSAIRDKLSALPPQEVLKLVTIARTVSANTTTNLTTSQIVALYAHFRSIRPDHVRHVSLAPYTHEVRTDDPTDDTLAIVPRPGQEIAIRTMSRDVFHGTGPIVTPSEIRLGGSGSTR